MCPRCSSRPTGAIRRAGQHLGPPREVGRGASENERADADPEEPAAAAQRLLGHLDRLRAVRVGRVVFTGQRGYSLTQPPLKFWPIWAEQML